MPGSESAHVLVLAAGRGRRMGGPKALMSVGGREWWRVQSERLGPCGLPVTWVVSEDVRAAMAGVPSPRLVVSDPDAPMFASLMAGIESIRSERPTGVFVLPVDVPAPLPTVFDSLAGASVAIPTYAGQTGHPVYLAREWIERVLLPIPNRAGNRLDELIRPDAVHMAVADPSVTVNLNSPDDIETWIRSTNLHDR